MGDFFGYSSFYYFDTGMPAKESPIRVIFDDPMKFYDKEGRRMIPAEERKEIGLSVKNLVNITLKDVKEFMKVEHDQENTTIQELLDGSIDDVSAELNRGWQSEQEVPVSIKTAIKQTTLSRYENRGEMEIPASAQGIIKKYRFIPGT